MTQVTAAKLNKVTSQVRYVARQEGRGPKELIKSIACGHAVIFSNKIRRPQKTCAVGKNLATKVNVNLGTSPDKSDVNLELRKLAAALELKADTVMDLSVGKDIANVRRLILEHSSIPVGTVPIYEAATQAQNIKGSFLRMDEENILRCIENQAKEGVDFFTIHCGITRESLRILDKRRRLINIVSRGGAIIAAWMKKNKQENPFYQYFENILDIAYKYDVVLSLGDALRPGAIADATDAAQLNELKTLAKCVVMARKKQVQVIVEGPGHVPIHQIKKNIELEKKLCKGAPFYVLGPLVCDVAAGYDHISAAIGGALAASFGADFLCYVTPAEHLRHPTLADVQEGIIASRIAAHSADIAKGIKKASLWDKEISQARNRRDWRKLISLAINPLRASEFRHSALPKERKTCSMCGKYCSMKLLEHAFN